MDRQTYLPFPIIKNLEEEAKVKDSVAYRRVAGASNVENFRSLNILCKNQLGLSAKEVIDQRVLLEAKRLLKGSDMSIKEIAFRLGFTGMAYFSYYMKSKTGLYPKQLRNFSVSFSQAE